MNPWLIVGFLIAIALATAGGFGAGKHYEGLQKEIAFQKERNDWAGQQHAIEDTHQKALAQAEAERDRLQRYISDTLAPKYARLAAANNDYQRALADRSNEHAKELPVDDHACDLPSGMFDDWKSANAGPGGGQGNEGLSGSGVDAAMRGAPAAGGAVPGAAEPKPPAGDGAIPRLR